MFVDACAIIALMTDEEEAGRVADALESADRRITSPVAVLEVVLALSRPDKFDLPVADIEPAVLDFLDCRSIDIVDLPPATECTQLAMSAAQRFRQGRRGLNICDCLHYACAKYYRVPILATNEEFELTDLETVK